ncbi:hypothetical protein ZIOFF_075091 [Zingiber officinale]|uniref:Uncharacterized protein n=1 Tax=Zingiber officinale TaxID=94328 RepID=A0A8J5C4U9_ZINOF|nr:hypothetical protein ZIOFF_075091 [Zingiber officinale]
MLRAAVATSQRAERFSRQPALERGEEVFPGSFARFIYPIYLLICIVATAVIDSFVDLFRNKNAVEDSLIVMIAKGLRSIFLDLILCASHSSTFSKFNGFAKAISNSRKQLIDMRENLLVTMDLVKIADFGLAREVHSKPPFTEYASTCCSIVG